MGEDWGAIDVFSIALLLGFFAAGIALYFISFIIFPIVWSHPWPETDDDKGTDKQRTVVMAGSFNPPHLGHEEMIRYLAARFGRVLVVVGHNPNKTYAVTPHQRVALLQECLSDCPTVSVHAASGLIWRHFPQASLFFRGIRTWQKDGSDERALQWLNTWGPVACGPLWWPRITYFLQGNPKYNHISSTLIRQICNDSSNDSRSGSTSDDSLGQLVSARIVGKVRTLYATTKED